MKEICTMLKKPLLILCLAAAGTSFAKDPYEPKDLLPLKIAIASAYGGCAVALCTVMANILTREESMPWNIAITQTLSLDPFPWRGAIIGASLSAVLCFLLHEKGEALAEEKTISDT